MTVANVDAHREIDVNALGNRIKETADTDQKLEKKPAEAAHIFVTKISRNGFADWVPRVGSSTQRNGGTCVVYC
jgi:hypothetical protein